MIFKTSDGLLRLMLYANGISTLFTSVGFLLFPTMISGLLFSEDFVFLGMSASSLVTGTGVFLAAFTGLVYLAIRQEHIPLQLAMTITALDIGWVLSTIIVLEFAWSVFSMPGLVFAIAIGLAVASFATGQTLGILQLKRVAA